MNSVGCGEFKRVFFLPITVRETRKSTRFNRLNLCSCDVVLQVCATPGSASSVHVHVSDARGTEFPRGAYTGGLAGVGPMAAQPLGRCIRCGTPLCMSNEAQRWWRAGLPGRRTDKDGQRILRFLSDKIHVFLTRSTHLKIQN